MDCYAMMMLNFTDILLTHNSSVYYSKQVRAKSFLLEQISTKPTHTHSAQVSSITVWSDHLWIIAVRFGLHAEKRDTEEQSNKDIACIEVRCI